MSDTPVIQTILGPIELVTVVDHEPYTCRIVGRLDRQDVLALEWATAKSMSQEQRDKLEQDAVALVKKHLSTRVELVFKGRREMHVFGHKRDFEDENDVRNRVVKRLEIEEKALLRIIDNLQPEDILCACE